MYIFLDFLICFWDYVALQRKRKQLWVWRRYLVFMFSLTLLVQLLLFYLSAICAKELPNVFTSLSTSTPNGNTPRLPWAASMRFLITPSMDARAQDTFSLDLPCTLLVYGTNGGSSIDMIDQSGNSFATCELINGYHTGPSRITCTLQQDVFYSPGQINFGFAWNVGQSPNSYSLQCAASFTSPRNTITWGGQSTTVTINRESFYQSSGMDMSHTISASAVDTYYLGYTCSRTFSETIELQLRGSPSRTGSIVSCANVDVYMTNSLNYWYMPMTAEALPSSSTVNCDVRTNTITVNANNIPAGYHVFVNAFQSRQFLSQETIQNTFIDTIYCGNSPNTNRYSRSWNFIRGSGNGAASM